MNNKFDILLCFDANYNLQGEVTMMSLLKNTSSQLTFYIIHENPVSLEKLVERISTHPNVENIYTYKFIKRDGVNFLVLMNRICQKQPITGYLSETTSQRK